ncbi:hypothetical protein [Terrabacter sp. BE26]|uniref:hypothetical protein n=1 Tax=Terrabacter sp. BE26 TaxID=2898152 RepID=UPI0035BE7958
MRSPSPRRSVAAAFTIGLTGLALVSGCSEPSAEASGGGAGPVSVATQDGKPPRITLTPKAAQRLGIRTEPATSAPQGGTRVPAAAILYSPDGKTFVYTNPEGNVFVPSPVVVVDILGDTARLSSGPVAGTKVVTVAAAELYGAETGLGAGH